MVRKVEELGPKLQFRFFCEWSDFFQREIKVGESGAGERVAAGVAVGTRRRDEISRGIEVLGRAAFDDVSMEVGIERWPDRIAAVSVVGWVESLLRGEWEPGLKRGDFAETPAVDEIAAELAGVVLADGKVPCSADDGEVAHIAARRTPVQLWAQREFDEGRRVCADTGVPRSAVVEVF